MSKIIVVSIFAFFLFSLLPFIANSKVSAVKENPFTRPAPDNVSGKINILLLGLDARLGDGNPRCDAIHMISYDTAGSRIIITSVPRGTEISLTKSQKDSYYIANYCHYFGIEAATSQIEKITGIHPDYVVKVGFSQVLGILRTLNMPTTDTLQYLRNRNSGYGDFQRSHNQAVFIKDAIVNYSAKIASVPNVFKYLIYKTVDTNMPYAEAMFIFDRMQNSHITQSPEFITLVTKPENDLNLAEKHFSGKEKNNMSDTDFRDYQNNLDIYFKNLLARVDILIRNNRFEAAYAIVKTPFLQQSWLQIEDEKKRDGYHFALLENFVQTTPFNDKLSSYLLDFITEMETEHKDELKNMGENLLKNTT